MATNTNKAAMTAPFFLRFIRFCLVGGSGVFVDMVVLYVLADATTLGWNLVLSKVCAAEVATMNNFVWNDLWTFRELAGARTTLEARLIRFGKFNLFCSIGIVISAIVLKTLAHGFAVPVYLANLAAIGVAAGWNFGMNYRFNWRAKDAATTPAAGRVQAD